MAGCCDPRGCERIFGPRFARQMAKRYRRRGLDATAGRLVDFLAPGDLGGASVLEIGGGIGEIGVELLRRGAGVATTLELTSAYDDEARRLAQDAGVADRAHRKVADIATSPDDVDPADIVVLHRVVCCYPDYGRLLGAAADHCRGRLAFSHPPRNVISRGVLATQNAAFRLMGREFRAFVHPPEEMVGVVEAHGMHLVTTHRGAVWQVAGLAR